MPKLAFSGQHAGEKVLLVFRRHVIALRKGLYGLLIPLVIGSIPFLIWQSNVALLWLPLIGLVVGCVIFFYHWIGWYFTIFILTNERIRQSTQKGLFGRTVVDLDLNKVQAPILITPGAIGEMLGYGTIILRTMVGDMTINKVPHYEEIYNELTDAIRDAGGKTEEEEHEQA